MIISAKDKKFYSVNVAVLTNEEVWFKDLAEEIENPVGSVGLLIE